jgi:hypothetical protein
MRREPRFKWFPSLVGTAILCFGMTLLIYSCVDDPIVDDPVEEPKPYAALEAQIRLENDWMAVFTWDDYSLLMTTLSNKKFLVLPLNEMRSVFDSSVVVVGLRHDIDFHPFKALEMADIEKHFNFRATYFVLATADYYGTISNSTVVRYPEMDFVYKELYAKGAEIGIHNDLLTLMILHNCDPKTFTLGEISHYESLGIPVYGTAAHGSQIPRELLVSNYEIFSDFAARDSITYRGIEYPVGIYSLRECGLEYEAYHISYFHYYSESGGKWNDPNGFSGIIDRIKASRPGDRIQILTHPVWWGRKTK